MKFNAEYIAGIYLPSRLMTLIILAVFTLTGCQKSVFKVAAEGDDYNDEVKQAKKPAQIADENEGKYDKTSQNQAKINSFIVVFNESVVTNSDHFNSDEPFTFETRNWDQLTYHYANNSVNHPNLYLAGSYETNPTNDGYFRTWSVDDAIAVVVDPAQMLIRAMLMPIDLACRPPWNYQISRAGKPLQEPTYMPTADMSQMAAREDYSNENPVGVNKITRQ